MSLNSQEMLVSLGTDFLVSIRGVKLGTLLGGRLALIGFWLE